MSVMAKSRADKSEAAESKRPNRSGVPINTHIDEDIRAAIDAFIADHNAKDEHAATLRSTVEGALKMYLKAKGFWPPPN